MRWTWYWVRGLSLILKYTHLFHDSICWKTLYYSFRVHDWTVPAALHLPTPSSCIRLFWVHVGSNAASNLAWFLYLNHASRQFNFFFFKMKYNTSNNPQPSRICFLFILMVLLAGMFCESQAGEFTSTSEDIQSHQMARLPPTLTLKSCLYCIHHCSLCGYYKTHTRGHICPFFQILLCARFFQ